MKKLLTYFFIFLSFTVFANHRNDSAYFVNYHNKAREVIYLRSSGVTATDTLLKPDSAQFYNTDLRYIAFADYAIYYRTFFLYGDTLYPPNPNNFYNSDLLYIAQANYAIYLRTFSGGGGGGGVTKIIAGTNIGITPTSGVGNVTINSTGGSGLTGKLSKNSIPVYTDSAGIAFTNSPITSSSGVIVIPGTASVQITSGSAKAFFIGADKGYVFYSTGTGLNQISQSATLGALIEDSNKVTISTDTLRFPTTPTQNYVWTCTDSKGDGAWKSASNEAWSLTGNSGTNPSTNFLGTTDNQPLMIRVDNRPSGEIDSATRRTMMGYRSGYAVSTTDNTGYGYEAGRNLTTGVGNTYVGELVGANTTTTFFNTAMGYKALQSDLTGGFNTAVGAQALQFDTGRYNTAMGSGAMTGVAGTRAEYNCAYGSSSLQDITTGDSNSGYGNATLGQLTSGAGNSAFGFGALDGVTTGIGNNGFGNYVGSFYNGNHSIFIGDSAAYNTSSGDNNILIGYKVIGGSTTKGNQTIIGNSSDTVAKLNSKYALTAIQPLSNFSSPGFLKYDGSGNISVGSAITGSGTLNTIPLFTPNGTTLGNSIITQSGGQIFVSGPVNSTNQFLSGTSNSINGGIIMYDAFDTHYQAWVNNGSPTSNIIYYFPTTQPTTGQVMTFATPVAGVSQGSWGSGGTITGSATSGQQTYWNGTSSITGSANHTFSDGVYDQLNSTSNTGYHGFINIQSSTNGSPSKTFWIKQRGTLASPTNVVAGDSAYYLSYHAYNGTNSALAHILGFVKKTSASNTVAGDMEFATSSINGGKSIAMAIDTSGNLTFNKYTAGVALFNGSGLISSGQVSLTSNVTGVLPIANGGTATSSVFNKGSVVFTTGSGGIYGNDSYNFHYSKLAGVHELSVTNNGDTTGTDLINLVNGQLDMNQAGSGTLSTNNGISFSAEDGTSTSPTNSSAGDTISGLQYWPYHGATWGRTAQQYAIVKKSSLIVPLEIHYQNRNAAGLGDYLVADTNHGVVFNNGVSIPVTANTMIGGTSSGGTFTISSTTNATKGNIYFGGSTGLNYDETNKRLGIGVAPSSNYLIDASMNSAAAADIRATNTNASTGAIAAFQAANNGAYLTQLAQLGTAYTTSGILSSNSGGIYSTNTASLFFINTAGTSNVFAINGSALSNQYMYTNSSYKTIIGENAHQPLPSGSAPLQFVDGQSYTNNLVNGTYPNFQHSATVGTPASSAQTTLFSDSITANTFARNGAILEITQTGQLNKTGTLFFYFGVNGSTSDTVVLNTGSVTVTSPLTWTMNTIIQRVSNTVVNVSYVLNVATSSKSLGGTLLSISGASDNLQIGNGTALALATTKYFWTVTGTSTAGLTANDITANIGYAKYITPK